MSVTVNTNSRNRNCRICLSYLWDHEYVQISKEISQLYEFCCGDDILIDQKHHVLCTNCSDKLKDFYEFKTKCHKSKLFWCARNHELELTLTPVKADEIELFNRLCALISVTKLKDEVKSDRNQRDKLCEKILIDELEQTNTPDKDEEIDPICTAWTSVTEVKDKIKAESLQKDIADGGVDHATASQDNVHKLKVKATLSCNKCHKKFRVKSKLVKHINTCSRVKNNLIKNMRKGKHEIMECGLCQASVSGLKEVSTHLHKHYSDNVLRCELCEFKGSDFRDMLVHRHDHVASRTAVCICSRVFKSPRELLHHFGKAHLGLNGFYCAPCRKDYTCRIAWRAHNCKEHSSKLECDYCGKKFTRPILIEHIRNIHMKITTCVCTLCGASFKKKSNLKLHEQSHVRAPVGCGTCGRVLKNAASLRAHTRRRHAPAPSPFACDRCPKAFRRPSELRYHSLVHSDERRHACDICSAAFKQRTSMYLHKRQVHSQQVTHRCEVCAAGFNNERSLRRHRSVHTGVRAHACARCPRSFHADAQLRRHELRQHSDVTDKRMQVTVTEDDVIEIVVEPVNEDQKHEQHKTIQIVNLIESESIESGELTEHVEFKPQQVRRQYGKKNNVK